MRAFSLLFFLIACISCLKPTKGKSYYEELEVAQTATLKEIKKAYFALAKLHHPDKVEKYDAKAQAKFERISRSYEILSDPKTRERYDKLLALGEVEYKDEQFAAADKAEAEAEQKQKAERKKKKDPKKAYEEALAREEELARAERNQLLILGAMGTAVLGLIIWFVIGKIKTSSYYKKSEKEKEEKAALQKLTENRVKQQILEQELQEELDRAAEVQAERLNRRLDEVEKEFAELDESKITKTEQDISVIDQQVAEHEEEERARKSRVPKVTLHCCACKKTFKSVPQWDNHVESNKHKSTVKALKGDAKAQFEKAMTKTSKLRDEILKQNKDSSTAESDESEEEQ